MTKNKEIKRNKLFFRLNQQNESDIFTVDFPKKKTKKMSMKTERFPSVHCIDFVSIISQFNHILKWILSLESIRSHSGTKIKSKIRNFYFVWFFFIRKRILRILPFHRSYKFNCHTQCSEFYTLWAMCAVCARALKEEMEKRT